MIPIFKILKHSREKKHLSQQAVADTVNIPLMQYQKYESGEQSLLSARTDVACRICFTLDLDPNILLEHVRQDTDDSPRKAVLYACFPSTSKEISEDALIAVAASTIENFRCEIQQTVIDYSGEVPCMRRDAWMELIQNCESECVELLIIPSILMLSQDLSEAVSYVRYLQEHNPCLKICFLYENLYTESDQFDLGLEFHYTVESYRFNLAQRKRNLRKIYNNALPSH